MDGSSGHTYEPTQTAPVLCSVPCLPRPRKIIINGRWILESVPQRRPIPAPWQRQASGRLCQQNAASPEHKYSNCEKALLCTVWAIQRFFNYIGAQKVIIETCHQPVTFLNSQWIRDGVVTSACIATWLMTFQGRNVGRPRWAERSPSSVKKVPTSLDRTPRGRRQALTCRLPNQNQTRAQRASPSMGPSKPDKEAPGLQPTGKGGRSNPLTQTDNHMLYTTQT